MDRYDGTVTHARCGGELPYRLDRDSDGDPGGFYGVRHFTTVEWVEPLTWNAADWRYMELNDDPYCRCEDITEAEYAEMIKAVWR